MIFSFYAQRYTEDQSIRYDEANVTPSDYTLFIRIDEQQNKVFEKYFMRTSNASSSRGM